MMGSIPPAFAECRVQALPISRSVQAEADSINTNVFFSAISDVPAVLRRLLRLMAGDIETNPGPSMTVMQWNCHGIFTKKAELEHLSQTQQPVVLFQETKLSPKHSFKINGYTFSLKARTQPHDDGPLRVGGFAIFVRDRFQYSPYPDTNLDKKRHIPKHNPSIFTFPVQ
ncbi:reverse transcriptase (RNA-dependent DNA polymerase) [Elysia marginata]|uniref:Reverse transcriptase (RNA-dependent DNA polymerase) n=1 Tax=Elysia marginata TaxID=1093978 RepID=A0AAV4GAP9_9GAST|nr:reverse transcriptase (RNA-dependent DNA polymerase) [Elysia marginata]